jgi:peptide/nickel transport system substrate-binding protein
MTQGRIGGLLVLVAAAGLLTLGVAVAGAGEGAAVKNRGTLTVALGRGEPDALDPTLARTFSGREVFLAICEKLYDINAHLQIVPQLAAAMPKISKDKLTVTIRIRKGIKFNDGTPLNAAAVKTTLDRDLTLAGSRRASEISPVDSVSTHGRYTVVIHLKSPYSPLTAQLADRAGMIMSPTQLDKLGSKFAQNPICVGPYQFKDRVAQDHITVTKSPSYYNKKNVHFNTIVFKIFNDPNALTQNLLSGSVDASDGIQATDIPKIKATSSLRIVKRPGIGYDAITINIGNKFGLRSGKPFQNVGTPLAAHPLLREAFEDALDRKLLNKVVLGGTAQPFCFPISPASPWIAAAKGLPCRTTRNLARAKQLVRRSGVPTPIRVKLSTPNDPISERLAAVIQSEERDAGFALSIEPLDFVTLLNREDAGNFDVVSGVGWSGRVDPDGNIYQFVHTTGSINDSGLDDHRLDVILDHARRATTPKARITLYHAALKIIRAERPIIVTDIPNNRIVVNKRVNGVTVYPDGLIRPELARFK